MRGTWERALGEGKRTLLGEAACATQGKPQKCQTLLVLDPLGDQRIAVAPVGDQLLASCNWAVDVPAQCAAIFTTMPQITE